MMSEQNALDPQLAAFEAATGIASDGKIMGLLTSEPIDVKQAVGRYVQIHGKTRVFDTQQQQDMSWPAFVALVGKPLAEEWKSHKDRRTALPADIALARRDAEQRRVQNDQTFQTLVERYVYLDGSDTLWDAVLDEVIPSSAAKIAMGELFKLWVNSPQRKIIAKRNLVFDPTQRVDPDTHINQFRGLPLQAAFPDALPPDARWATDLVDAFPDCAAIIRLSLHLCNNDPMVWMWLMCWLAYPLQHPGAKMATCVLMHSDVHGSGKSLFFEECIKPLYGEYATTIGQDQLDGSFSGWRSRKLFLLGEEISNNTEKYQQAGKLKHLVTGKTQVVERKFVDAWEEVNHANFVMLSNLYMPAHVESSDRRFMVIWPDSKLPEADQKAVEVELAAGGVTAFYAFLLSLPLALPDCAPGAAENAVLPFTPHTKPWDTEARMRLIRLGMSGWEAFIDEWERGVLGVPFTPCRGWQLYGMYCEWCQRGREKTILPKRKFLNMLSGRLRSAVERWRCANLSGQETVYTPREQRPDPGEPKQDWFGRHIMGFSAAALTAGWDVDGWETYKDAAVASKKVGM